MCLLPEMFIVSYETDKGSSGGRTDFDEAKAQAQQALHSLCILVKACCKPCRELSIVSISQPRQPCPWM